jgi:hypothetical protein
MKSSLCALALSVALSGGAQAVNIATGSLWHVPEAVTLNAVPANIPATPPDVTFAVNAPFNFSATNATVSAWLATSSAFNIVENTPGTLAGLMDNGVFGSILEFTGSVTVTNGQQFTVTHDDGLTLIIGGTDLGFSPLPTSPIQSIATYTGPSGNFPFQLVYAECCGGPAVLQVDLPFVSTQSVPEGGSTLPLLGGIFSAMALAARKFRKKA